MVFISIIVPVYNRKKLVGRCINSILKQTFTDFEVIIVDDGSDDGTGPLCDAYAEKYSFIKVIHQRNKGVSSARNIGVKNAEGQMCIFVDSDDCISSDYLLQIKNAYEKFGDEVVYVTAFKIFTKKDIQYFRYRKGVCYSEIKNEKIFELMDKGFFNSSVNKVYQMSLLKKYDIKFPEKLNLGEDLIFNLRYIDKQNKIAFIFLNETLYMGNQKRSCSLESCFRIDYFDIQRKLLKEKIKFFENWINEGKLSKKSREIIKGWYGSFVNEIFRYYIKHAGRTNILQMIKIIIKIKKSPEYFKVRQLKKEERNLWKDTLM